MKIGYTPGTGPLHRAHPFTPLTLAAVLAVLAFLVPLPYGPMVLCGIAIALAIVERVPGVLVPAALTALPFWLFLFLIHGVLGGKPLLALGLAGRITAIIVTFLTAVSAVHPARLVDAMLERGIPFSLAYVFASTLQAVPRLRRRAREILDAQRCRGLSVGGSLWRRARALLPLAAPLILGALAEVDERAFALAARGAGHVKRRTPLYPPRDKPGERKFRWALVATVVVAVIARVAW
jgi:energy-coupling factor transport system permease protein